MSNLFKRFQPPKPEIPEESYETTPSVPSTPTPSHYSPVIPTPAPAASSYSYTPEPAVSHAPIMHNTNNVLCSDVEIQGSLKFNDELYFDGKITGEITSQGNLTVGESAVVNGEIKTRSVVIYGRVEGNVAVSERCELKANSELVGDLKAARLMIEEGASFCGKSEVASMSSAPAPSTKSSGGFKVSSTKEEKEPATADLL